MSYRAYIAARIDAYLEELSRFAAIPSVAADESAVHEAAEFTANAFARRGFGARVLPSDGNPVVLAASGTGPPAVLLYNHYDVQPATPVGEWTTDPFAPALRDGNLFGRGVIDDKGEIVARLAAIDALRARFGDLPLRVVACVEGEEEAGSPNLGAFVSRHREALRADACIWEAGEVDGGGRPHVWLGVRGLAYLRLHVRTLAHDAHSGWAHVLPNAAWRLTHALSRLVDADGRILIEGLCEAAAPPTAAQSALLDAMPDQDEEYHAEFGIERFVGNRDSRALRAAVFLPTCNISGVWSGSIDGPSKTVIPSQANARLDLRLPPAIAPERAVELLRAHLDVHGFTDVEVVLHEAERAACSDPNHPFVEVVTGALRDVYGTDPVVVPLVGGTGPAAHFVDALNVPFASIGCSYPGARKHAPDEHIRVADFIAGAAAIATVFERFAGRVRPAARRHAASAR